MNSATEQVMQSSRYLDEKVKVLCVCCEQESFDHSGYCNNCQAPLDLSRTAEKRGLPFHFLSVLGASDVKETRYPGVWLLTHYNEHETIIGRFLEVCDVPGIIKSQTDDIRTGLARLEDALANAETTL